ncbi:MAG: peptide deformylase [Oscillospiraceae bacterium]
MIKEIVHDTFFLQMKSTPACEEDLQTAADLLETLKAHTSDCVGMAANMIGVSKRIIAVNDNGQFFVMLNPEIIKCSGAFETEEGCLSLSGTRKTKRYKNIKVKFQNTLFQERIKTFSGWTAQIIQHEIDHCNGILI